MATGFSFASLIPLGLMVDGVDYCEDSLVVTARSGAIEAPCPVCGTASRRVQSHYIRHPSDLPCSGRRVRLQVLVRRFWCDVLGCQRQVFAGKRSVMAAYAVGLGCGMLAG
jgi:transposase